MFGKKKIIVLEMRSSLTDAGIEKLEEKFSKKFGYKVVMLPPSVDPNFRIIK